MSEAEFDRHATHYRQLHAANIAVTGEEPEYFARYKMRDLARIVRAAGVPADGRYLDFGSGVGASVKPFRDLFPSAHLSCADVSAQSLAAAQQAHGKAAEYALIRSGRLPFESASVDAAFACCVFHHIPAEEHVPALAELRRVLKPAAPLMVYEHNPLNPLTVRAVNTCALDENAVLIHARTLASHCRAAGFANVSRAYRVFFPASLRWLRPLENGLARLPLGAQYFVVARA
jgi:ubiquinone/menaquinone biosynthesis C-methylase UbiE